MGSTLFLLNCAPVAAGASALHGDRRDVEQRCSGQQAGCEAGKVALEPTQCPAKLCKPAPSGASKGFSKARQAETCRAPQS